MGGQAAARDAGDLRGDHDQPADGGRRFRGGSGVCPRARASVPDRQHLCLTVQLPPAKKSDLT